MRKLRPRRSDAPLVVSVIALIVALAGTGYAALVPPKSIGPKQLKNNAVTKPKLKNNAVTGSKLHDGAVGETELQGDAVDETKLQDGAVGEAEMQDNAVGVKKLKDNAVTKQKLGDNSVNKQKLEDDAVSRQKLEDGAVGGQKLEDKAVTASKLGDAAVTSTAIQPGAIEADALAPNAVTSASIEPQSLTPDAFAPGTLAETAVQPSGYTGVAANDTWTFYGQPNQVDVTTGQSIIGQGQALLATPPGSLPQLVYYAMCFKASTDTEPKPMGRTAATPDNLWGTVYAGNSPDRLTPFVAVGAVSSAAAGTYDVGFCVNNPAGGQPLALAHANEVVGWSQATN